MNNKSLGWKSIKRRITRLVVENEEIYCRSLKVFNGLSAFDVRWWNMRREVKLILALGKVVSTLFLMVEGFSRISFANVRRFNENFFTAKETSLNSHRWLQALRSLFLVFFYCALSVKSSKAFSCLHTSKTVCLTVSAWLWMKSWRRKEHQSVKKVIDIRSDWTRVKFHESGLMLSSFFPPTLLASPVFFSLHNYYFHQSV